MPLKERAMKDTKPNREAESNPSRFRTERPDNGAKSCKVGPSSDSHKDNPHKSPKLASHATVNC